MKKLIASVIALVAINASAYDVTNTVTIVSNIYNRISREYWTTNNVKNTHANYYYTNNVYTISNVTLLVSQQTFKTNTTVNLDVSQQAIADARAQANRAAEAADDASDYASASASSATAAQGYSVSSKDYRDEAQYYAQQAHGQVQPIIDEGNRQIARVEAAGNTQVGRVNATGTSVINQIDSEKQWFEDHFGQMITNVEVTVTTNIYHNEDTVARQGVANNATNIAKNAEDITGLDTRVGAAETSISNLKPVAFSGDYNDLINKPSTGPATELIINEDADNERPHVTYTVYNGTTTSDPVYGWIKIYKGNYNINYGSNYFSYQLNDTEGYLSIYPSSQYAMSAYYNTPNQLEGGFNFFVRLNSGSGYGTRFSVSFPNFTFKGRLFDLPNDTETYVVKDYSGRTVNWLVKKTEDTISNPSNYYKMKGLKIYDKSGNHVDTVQLESNKYTIDEMKLIFKYLTN